MNDCPSEIEREPTVEEVLACINTSKHPATNRRIVFETALNQRTLQWLRSGGQLETFGSRAYVDAQDDLMNQAFQDTADYFQGD